MGLRDWWEHRKAPTPDIMPELGGDDAWTPVRKSQGQRKGRVTGRHGQGPEVHANPRNREERRLYIRYLQPSRQVRRNIVGFGRWRRPHNRADYPITPGTGTGMAPRAARRPAAIARAKATRRAGQ